MENRARGLFEEAYQKMEAAGEELCRPEEDVVSFLVCKHSHVAIENFLKGFLLKNNIDPEDFKTINDLHEKCVELNGKFGEIDFSALSCKSYKPDTRSCNTISKVNGCYELAGNINSLLLKEKIFI